MGIEASEVTVRKIVVLLALLGLWLCNAHPGIVAQGDTATDPLIGIWTYATKFTDTLEGQLVVSRENGEWHATISNSRSTAILQENSLRFVFTDGSEFRATVGRKIDTINGFWIQPASVPDSSGLRDPSGAGQSFASPLSLRRTTTNTWRGLVRPLDRHFTLYLRIFRDPNGTLVGAFRNPEANSTHGANQYRVSREGTDVVFSTGADPAKPTIRFTAILKKSPDKLRVDWPDVGGSIELERCSLTIASSFFPRPANAQKYVYSKPPALGDGWDTARAQHTGMDEALLVRLVQRLIDSDPSIRRPNLMHSLLIAHRGKLVLEEYFFGFDHDQQHDMRSAGKTFSSVMLGAVIRQGKPVSPESRIYDMVASIGPFSNPDSRKSQITLAHLMTHTSGLACNDNDEVSPGGENLMQAQTRQPNWWKYTLDLPIANDPGKRYAYCSAGMNLVGAGLTVSTQTWLPELFDRTVARPLEFGMYYWNLMPNGEGYLGGGAYLLPRDLLKVGQMYLDGGVWKGRRIVDASWVSIRRT